MISYKLVCEASPGGQVCSPAQWQHSSALLARRWRAVIPQQTPVPHHVETGPDQPGVAQPAAADRLPLQPGLADPPPRPARAGDAGHPHRAGRPRSQLQPHLPNTLHRHNGRKVVKFYNWIEEANCLAVLPSVHRRGSQVRHDADASAAGLPPRRPLRPRDSRHHRCAQATLRVGELSASEEKERSGRSDRHHHRQGSKLTSLHDFLFLFRNLYSTSRFKTIWLYLTSHRLRFN